MLIERLLKLLLNIYFSHQVARDIKTFAILFGNDSKMIRRKFFLIETPHLTEQHMIKSPNFVRK